MQTWKTGVLALAAVTTLLTGCGGSDDDDGDAAVSGSVDLSEELDEPGVDGDCAEALEAMSGAAGGMTNALSGEVDSLEEAVEAMEDYADGAPEEIRDDFRLMASAYAEIVEVIVENDIDLSSGEAPDEDAMAAFEEATSSLDDEELSAATDRVQAFFEEECKTDG